MSRCLLGPIADCFACRNGGVAAFEYSPTGARLEGFLGEYVLNTRFRRAAMAAAAMVMWAAPAWPQDPAPQDPPPEHVHDMSQMDMQMDMSTAGSGWHLMQDVENYIAEKGEKKQSNRCED